jgi:2-polyprenyl-3-methyl-5-hydroxy-6-metoxy-1,4-benzoquinol methylase
MVKEYKTHFSNKKIVGIDYSQRAIDIAKALNPTSEFKRLNIIEDKINERYDLITLIEVFEHIPLELTDKFIDSLQNILNKDGVLLLTVPHKNRKLQDKHFQHFDIERIKTYFNNYFIVEEVVFFEKTTRGFSLLKKILSNNLFILNSIYINNMIYRLYKKYYFYSDEGNCGRIFVKMTKK